MIVNTIHYSANFAKQFKKLPSHIQELAEKKQLLFRENPLYPSLRLHALHGRLEETWSISITKNYRIVFNRKNNGDIVFHSIGTHDIYKNL